MKLLTVYKNNAFSKFFPAMFLLMHVITSDSGDEKCGSFVRSR